MTRKHPLSDLDADIRDHIEREAQENVERGMSPDDARYAALRKFGNVTLAREHTRMVWIPTWLDQLRQDLRHTIRTLRSARGIHRHGPAFAGTRYRCERRNLFAGRPGRAARPPGEGARASRSAGLERQPARHRMGHRQPHVIPALPRPARGRALLRRRFLSPSDDRELLDRTATRARSRRDRVGFIFFSARRTCQARSTHRAIGRSSAWRPSGGGALPPFLADPFRGRGGRHRTESPRQQLSDDGYRCRASRIRRSRSARHSRTLASGHDDRAGGSDRCQLESSARSARCVDEHIRAAQAADDGSGRQEPRSSPGSPRCSLPTCTARGFRTSARINGAPTSHQPSTCCLRLGACRGFAGNSNSRCGC